MQLLRLPTLSQTKKSALVESVESEFSAASQWRFFDNEVSAVIQDISRETDELEKDFEKVRSGTRAGGPPDSTFRYQIIEKLMRMRERVESGRRKVISESFSKC